MTPNKRQDDLVVEQTGSETLVYDLRTDAAHSLDASAAAVLRAADGRTPVEAIATATGLTLEQTQWTISRLAELDLLEPLVDTTRRDLLRKVAVVGAAAAVGLPVIRSLQAPEAAEAATKAGLGQPCSGNGNCQSGFCVGGICVAAP